MDEYTRITKEGLENRFRLTDNDGIYFGFQPIYGFDKGCCEAGLLPRYTRTYAIVKALSHMKFDSLLDVGGAEGYTANVIKTIFHGDVMHAEVSEEACKRARQLFGLDSTQANITDLPFCDGEYEIVLCSDTLEHVPDFMGALRELLRVAKKAVIITVPIEPIELIEKIREENEFHGHIHNFDINSFDFLTTEGYHLPVKVKIVSLLSRFMTALIEPECRVVRPGMGLRRYLVPLYNMLIPGLRICKNILNKYTFTKLIEVDGPVCSISNSYAAALYVICKEENFYSELPLRKAKASQIMEVVIPFCRPD